METCLENQCADRLFELIPRLMQIIRREARTTASGELTVPQLRVLHRLSEGPATNSDLAEWIGVSLPAMSKMIDIMVKRGLVQRQRGRTDRRQVKLSLTSAGAVLQERAKLKAREFFVRRMKKLPCEKLEALESAFKTLKNTILESEETSYETVAASHCARGGDRADRLRASANFKR